MYRKRDGANRRGPEAVRGFAGECEGTPLARPPGPGQEAVAVTTIEKAKNLFPWFPEKSLADGVREIIRTIQG